MATFRFRNHKRYRQKARLVWPDNLWISGEGRFASASFCRHHSFRPAPTIQLHNTLAAAGKAKTLIDSDACGNMCTNKHFVFDLEELRSDLEINISAVAATKRRFGHDPVWVRKHKAAWCHFDDFTMSRQGSRLTLARILLPGDFSICTFVRGECACLWGYIFTINDGDEHYYPVDRLVAGQSPAEAVLWKAVISEWEEVLETGREK